MNGSNGVGNSRPGLLAAACFVAGIAAASCSSSQTGRDAGSDGRDGGSILAMRPYNFKVPTRYDKSTPTPLVIMLHGYAVTSGFQEDYFQFGAVADEQTFLYAYPDGTLDPANNRFWNADDACCNFFASAVDDVAYVNALIEDRAYKPLVSVRQLPIYSVLVTAPLSRLAPRALVSSAKSSPTSAFHRR